MFSPHPSCLWLQAAQPAARQQNMAMARRDTTVSQGNAAAFHMESHGHMRRPCPPAARRHTPGKPMQCPRVLVGATPVGHSQATRAPVGQVLGAPPACLFTQMLLADGLRPSNVNENEERPCTRLYLAGSTAAAFLPGYHLCWLHLVAMTCEKAPLTWAGFGSVHVHPQIVCS